VAKISTFGRELRHLRDKRSHADDAADAWGGNRVVVRAWWAAAIDGGGIGQPCRQAAGARQRRIGGAPAKMERRPASFARLECSLFLDCITAPSSTNSTAAEMKMKTK